MSAPIALITGANRTDGIGYAAARQLALQHGFTVVLGSRTLSPALDAAARQLEKEGTKNGVHAVQIDVASSDSVRKAAKEVSEKFGKLDVRDSYPLLFLLWFYLHDITKRVLNL